jgi:hypothetical protein
MQEGATGFGSQIRATGAGLWRIVPAVGVLGIRQPPTGAVKVTAPLNLYAEDPNCVGGVDKTVLTYVVPALNTLNILGLVGWGAYDGEFLIKINAITIGGGRTSSSHPTLEIYYDLAYKIASPGQVVTVTIRVNDYTTGTYLMKCNLLGALV